MTSLRYTQADVDRLEAEWLRCQTDPRVIRRTNRENLRRNLPRKTRFRLALHHLNNKALIWFCIRKGSAAARKLWRM